MTKQPPAYMTIAGAMGHLNIKIEEHEITLTVSHLGRVVQQMVFPTPPNPDCATEEEPAGSQYENNHDFRRTIIETTTRSNARGRVMMKFLEDTPIVWDPENSFFVVMGFHPDGEGYNRVIV